MSRFASSKFKHTRPSEVKKELWYYDIQCGSSGDFTPFGASSKFLGLSWSTTGGGSVGVIPLGNSGKTTGLKHQTINAHSGRVTGLEWSYFDSNLLSTSSEDCSVKLWSIPDDGDLPVEPIATLAGHKKDPVELKWHRTAPHILASGGKDSTVKLWDVEGGDAKCSISLDDWLFSMDWSYNCSTLATTSRDKKISLIDPRAQSIVSQADSHEGVKASLLTWMGDSPYVCVTGFTKYRKRKFGFWDTRSMDKPVTSSELDSSTGVLRPFFDADSKVLVLAGIGDGSIHLFEHTDKKPFYNKLEMLRTSNAQKSICALPKHAVDVMQGEILRFYKLLRNEIVPITLKVPRKSYRKFHDDLFPRSASDVPTLSADEWWSGSSPNPNLMSLDPADRRTKDTTSTSGGGAEGSSAPTPRPGEGYDKDYVDPSLVPDVVARPSPTARTLIYDEKRDAPEMYVPKTVKIVRSTKFRHLVTKVAPKSEWWTSLRVGACGQDAQALRGNTKWLAVPWEGGGGRIAVLDRSKPKRLLRTTATVENSSSLVCFEFSPFHQDLLVAGLDNATINVWKIPEDGVQDRDSNYTDKAGELRGHTRRLSNVFFHPLAENVLVSTAMEYAVRLWDLEKCTNVNTIKGHENAIHHVDFNYEGSSIVTTSKDKQLRLFDLRAGTQSNSVKAHDGARSIFASWMGNRDQIFSTGMTRGSYREVALWDVRNMDKALKRTQVDTGSGALWPHYDEDTGVVFVFAMGDGSVKYFECTSEKPFLHPLTEYGTKEPQAGIALMPKSVCDVKNVEIKHFYKLSGDKIIPMVTSVPRTRKEFFQDDVYPPTRVEEPSMSADEWFSGANTPPKLRSQQPEGMTPVSEAPKVERKMIKFDKEKAANTPKGDMKDIVVSRFKDKMDDWKEEAAAPLPQDRNKNAVGVMEEEWDEDYWGF